MALPRQLVLEYVFEGHKRGYNFTSPTQGFDDAVLKTIWRNAMPRGQGWGAAHLLGAQALKSFPLPDGQVAVSEVTVTDQEDEHGRRGIRRALVDVFTVKGIEVYLRSRLATYSLALQNKATLMQNHLYNRFPRLKKDQPLILSYPYTTPEAWRVIEALMLVLMLNPPRPMQRKAESYAFTSLALDYRDETLLVAMPSAKAATITDVVVTPLKY